MIDYKKEGNIQPYEIMPLDESKIEVDFPKNVTNLDDFIEVAAGQSIDLAIWIYGHCGGGIGNHYIWLTKKQAESLYQKLGEKLKVGDPRFLKMEENLTLIGRLKGYSGCGRCGNTWNWKERESISYSETRGMFPLCKECFKELSEEEILSYCKKLMKCWDVPGISKNWDKMIDNLKTDIHKLKKNRVSVKK